MRGVAFIFFWLISGFACGAEPCPGNPAALGTSRIITISPSEFSRIGSLQYKQTLPLNDHEVVITFDDGPIPPYSNIILDTLAAQCVKATYFLVGEMAHSHPSIVRRIYNAGHSIGSHSQNHPLKFQRLSMDAVEHEVDDGIASIDMALGDPKALSPFFRIPGFGRTDAIDDYLASKALVTWSTDIAADDWKRIGAREIVRRAMRRLEAKGRGILLLHDIHPATVLTLPVLWSMLWRQEIIPNLSRMRQQLPTVLRSGRELQPAQVRRPFNVIIRKSATRTGIAQNSIPKIWRAGLPS
jgi:peptidoglycan/xylan/chitin deacetylase (PgdA/CDA1 family)